MNAPRAAAASGRHGVRASGPRGFGPDNSVRRRRRKPNSNRCVIIGIAMAMTSSRAAGPASSAKHNLPAPLTSLIGRTRELTGGGGRLSPPHHRTVRAAVEWSHQLLDPAEQRAFRSLAVFVGGFDAEAASSVARGLSLEVLARLVDESLVAVMESARGRTRYRLLETVREYAHELLVEAGEPEAARERHLRHSRRSPRSRARSGSPPAGNGS